MEQSLKRCSRCGLDKPLNDFFVDKRNKYNLTLRTSGCKACRKLSARLNYDPLKQSEYGKKSRQKNLEAIRARERQYYQDTRKARLESSQKWRERNRTSIRASDAKYKRDNYHNRFAERLRCLYGLTVHDYESLVAKQEGRCAICQRIPARKLRVDHDHRTGIARELLCMTCNSGIGMLGDDVSRLTRALAYLVRHATSNYFLDMTPANVTSSQ